MNTSEQTIFLKWETAGLMDFLRGYITAELRLGSLGRIVPCFHPDNLFSKVFSWACTENFERHTDFCLDTWSKNESENIWKQVERSLFDSGSVTIRTNLCPPHTADLSRFKRLFSLNVTIQRQILERIRKTVQGDYSVIHTRLIFRDVNNQMFFNSNSRIQSSILERALSALRSIPNEGRIVLLSDSQEFLDAAGDGYIRSGSRASHSFRKDLTMDDVLDILTDLWFIIGAKDVKNINVFTWGTSGFSKIPCQVFGIPYQAIKI